MHSSKTTFASSLSNISQPPQDRAVFRPLLYTVAFGRFTGLAKMMIQSARVHGFTGDVLLLCDSDFQMEGCQVVNVRRHEQISRFAHSGPGLLHSTTDNSIDYLILRTGPHYFADVSPYSHLIYCDADALFFDTVESVFPSGDEFCAQMGGPLRTRLGLLETMMSAAELSESESYPSVNAGIFSIPITLLPFLSLWMDTHFESAHLDLIYRDQQVLNYLLLTRRIPVRNLPRIFCGRDGVTEGLVHYLGHRRFKEQMALDYRRKIARRIAPGKRARIGRLWASERRRTVNS